MNGTEEDMPREAVPIKRVGTPCVIFVYTEKTAICNQVGTRHF